jgi:molybdopterin molybdotransferase
MNLISIEKAKEIIFNSLWESETVILPLEYISGLVLAEDIVSDIDVPLFDKAMMDGYAIKASDSGDGAELKIDGTLTAGDFYKGELKKGHVLKIMTGAPIPKGADAVIQWELTSELSKDTVKLKSKIEKGFNIARQGEEFKKGQVVIGKGTVITAPVAAVCAIVGKEKVQVYPRPSVLIIPTGSELIEIINQPEKGMIRESNSYSLLAQCDRWGAASSRRPIVRDAEKSLFGSIGDSIDLNPEIIILTGGVSEGEYDLVPKVCAKLGVKILFHKVAQKPGKPMLFGIKDEILIFGLPGNPASVFTTFEIYVGPAIRRLLGEMNYETPMLAGIAGGDFKVKSNRTWITQCVAKYDGNSINLFPVKSKGSADIHSVIGTNALSFFPEGDYIVKAGEKVNFMLLRGENFGT